MTLHCEFPLFMGSPHQRQVLTIEDFAAFCKEHERGPVYATANAHPAPDRILMEYYPSDFDAKGDMKLENTLADVLQQWELSKKRDGRFFVNFTGGRGFHTYFKFIPELTVRDDALKRVFEMLRDTMKAEAKLRTLDMGVGGDTRRILRVTNTRHEKTGLYCVRVPEDMLDRADINEIVTYARTPQPVPDEPEPTETLREFVRRNGFKLIPRSTRAVTAATIPYRGHASEFVKDVLPRMCIHSGLMQNNPPHHIRFEACSTLVNCGFGLEWIVGFFQQVADDAKWVDRHNIGETGKQVLHIWKQGRNRYSPQSCETIREKGGCVGKTCPIYDKVFPTGDAKHG